MTNKGKFQTIKNRILAPLKAANLNSSLSLNTVTHYMAIRRLYVETLVNKTIEAERATERAPA